jgi:curli production assembly/transport component CsgF
MNQLKSLFGKVWVLLAMSTPLAVHAGELRYTPVNPTFGGNPLNASALQANASAQNDYKAPVAPKAPAPTELEKFTENIQSAILSRIQSTTVNALFDKNGLVPGKEYGAGNFTVKVTNDPNKPGELILVTTDKLSNQSTTINISSFGAFE